MQSDQLLASESNLPQQNVTQQTTNDQWELERSQPEPIAQETDAVPIGQCVHQPNTQQTVSATIEPNVNHVVTSHIRDITQQSTSTSQRSLPTDSASAVRYHVVNNARDSDCESGIVHSYVQLNVSGAASNRSTGDVSTAANVRRTAEERRRQKIKYRRRRNRIGLLLVFATLLLFAGLVVCANTREYVAGATISVIGVLLGSSSMVLCLVTTDSCERVHGFRERVYSYHRRRGSSFVGGASANDRSSGRTRPRRGDAALSSVSAANSSLNVHDTMIVHAALPPTAVCSLSGDFLDHLPPPTYETAEILMREDLARDQGFSGDMSGAVGGASDYQYYKVSQAGSSVATPATSTTNLATTSAAADPSCGHLCDDCVQRQQSTLALDASGGSAAAATPESEHLLIAPTIVVELPTYDEAIAEDTCRDAEETDHCEPDS